MEIIIPFGGISSQGTPIWMNRYVAEADYKIASEDGMNIFRHWFLWSAIEVAPGEFDWEDYDRQLELAAKNGMKTIIAERIAAAPEWAFRKFAHARLETRDGRKVESHMSGSCVTGGFPGLCLDNDDYKQAAERFLKELVNRYKNHPGLGGYDIMRQPLPVRLELGEAWGPFSSSHSLWGAKATAAGRTITLIAGARDVAVIALLES